MVGISRFGVKMKMFFVILSLFFLGFNLGLVNICLIIFLIDFFFCLKSLRMEMRKFGLEGFLKFGFLYNKF